MFTADIFMRLVDTVDVCPWNAAAGRPAERAARPERRAITAKSLYTPDERRRRDATNWTVVQGVLAPIQFLIFAVSLALVLRYLATGDGEAVATFSIIVKTLVLYTIMFTGAIWEKEVFGRYLFAPAFYWEDMVSMVVIGLHTIYLAAVLTGALSVHQQMMIALAAYGTYVINATQFVYKLRAARLSQVIYPTAGEAAFGLGR